LANLFYLINLKPASETEFLDLVHEIFTQPLSPLHEQCVNGFLLDGIVILNQGQMICAQGKRPKANSSTIE
ncbi:MAG: hypothetical protein ABI618_20325, partial [Nitrospirota bacterium]